MARFAIGDVQGCATELRALLGAIEILAPTATSCGSWATW